MGENSKKLFINSESHTALTSESSDADVRAADALGIVDEDGDVIWGGNPHAMRPRPGSGSESVDHGVDRGTADQ
jgi:hypothetical protein